MDELRYKSEFNEELETTLERPVKHIQNYSSIVLCSRYTFFKYMDKAEQVDSHLQITKLVSANYIVFTIEK